MTGISRTSASLLVGLALVCVVSLAGWWLTRSDDQGTDCPVVAEPQEPAAQFVDREALLPSGTVGERRREVVDALDGLGPIGTVKAGRFFEQRADVPALVALGERLTLVTATADEPAQLDAVDLGAAVPVTDWSTSVSPTESGPAWSTFTGGAVGEDWVSVFSGARPALLALDPEGAERTCLALPAGGESAGDPGDVVALTDQSGSEVVVLTSSAAGWWLGVIDPAQGEVVSSTRSAVGGETWQEVKVSGDLVVGSRWAPSTVGTSGVPRPQDAQRPWVRAWGLDGEERWAYPAEAERGFPAVLLDLADKGTAYVVSFDRGGPWLDAVDADGRLRWRVKLRPGEWSGSLWDDVVVVRGPDPAGGPMLRAFDVRDGRERWVVRSRQAPPVGDAPRGDFGSPLTDRDAHWVPSPNGLLRIDRGSDAVRRVDSRAVVDELLEVGDAAVVRSGAAVLVTEAG